MRKFKKLFTNNTVRGLDEENRTAEYIISSDDIDRMGEVVEQSWQLDHYKKNPVVLWGHDPSKADNVIGRCEEIETYEEDGKTYTKARVKFAEEGTSKNADTIWKLVKQNILRTVSVGFIPHTFKTTDVDGDENKEANVLADNELLEFSIVAIPANPNAVALAYDEGTITEKEAKYLLKTYKTEVAFIEKSLCDTISKDKDNETETDTNKGAKQMSDEDVQKLSMAIAEALKPSLDEIKNLIQGEQEEDPAEEEQPQKSAKSEQSDDGGADEQENLEEELDEEAEKAYIKQLEQEYAELDK